VGQSRHYKVYKYRVEYTKIALSELRSQFYNVLSCCITGLVFKITSVKRVKTGNIDVGGGILDD
jgi:hypothetical protein